MSVQIVNICSIAKNEEAYVEDWLYYHFCLGFDNITIYDNNDIENRGRLKKVIKRSNKLNRIMKQHTFIVDCCGKNGYQRSAYNDYYNNNCFDWCAFIDLDEFITLKKWNNIKEMINDEHFKDTDIIYFPWLTIGDDDIIDVPDNFLYNGVLCRDITDINIREQAAQEWNKIPVYNRLFKTVYNNNLIQYKPLIRRKKNINIISPHNVANASSFNISLTNYKYPLFDINKNSPSIHQVYLIEDEYNFAFLRHYRTKTIREYLNQKYKNKSDAMNYKAHTTFITDYFFKFNRKTEDKINYYNIHHIPITLHIITNEEDYNKVDNAADLCYITKYKDETNDNPYLITLNYMIEHLKQIDYINIV